MKNYVAKLGTPDALKQLDTEGDRDQLVPAANVYEAHKKAMNLTRNTEEVLTITLNNKRVYDIVTGFAAEM